MNFYFVRHGHTDWNEAKKIQGSCDIELSEKGVLQAHILADTIKEKEINVSQIYTSPQKRALKTAKIISETLAVPLAIKNGLKEINFGKWEGLTFQEVKSEYPKEYEAWFYNRRYQTSPSGESYQHLMERSIKVLCQIENKADVMVVTHSAVIMCLACLIHNVPFEKMNTYKVANTAIIKLSLQDIKAAREHLYS